MVVRPERIASVASAAHTLQKNRSRYEAVSAKTGVPWYMIAAIHMREASADFTRHLHNGDSLQARTHQVPAGRPATHAPPFTWEESAIDALTMPPHSLHLVTDWSIERVLYETEKYNGWGYWLHGDNTSAYLWAGSDIDHGGKYIADHVWSSTAQDSQNGAALTMRLLLTAPSETAKAPPANVQVTSPVPLAAPQQPAIVSPPAPPISTSVNPYGAIGGLLNILYGIVQAVLKRKT